MATTNLGRPATGLPRYYMDCGWYRHPSWIGVGLDSIGLFEAIVGYCTEHATDGIVPADPDDLAVALGLRAREVRKALRPLVERGRLVAAAPGLLGVPSWADHNPTKAELEELSKAKSKSGIAGNHARWHVKQGRFDPDCQLCRESQPDPEPDRTSDRTGSQPESQGKKEGRKEPSTSLTTGSTASDPEPAELDHGSDMWLHRLATQVGDDMRRLHDDGWLVTELRALHRAHPGASGETLIAMLRAGERAA